MEPQQEVPPYIQRTEFVSTRSLSPQDVRGESIPNGLHIYGRTEGNEKWVLGPEYRQWGNQDRLIYAVTNDLTIAGVADEGQGADSVDVLGQLLTDRDLRQRLVCAPPAEREKELSGINFRDILKNTAIRALLSLLDGRLAAGVMKLKFIAPEMLQLLSRP